MPVRTIQGTLDTFSVNAGSEITYEGPTRAGDKGLNIRGFKVNPTNTGNLTVTIDRSSGVQSIEIFQESDYSAGAAPAGYQRIFNIGKAGKGGGAVGISVTNAAEDYIVLLTLDGYSEVSYTGSVDVP
jgi:hypothetical protein